MVHAPYEPAARDRFEPETKEECKKCGPFEDLALFKNQGDCVAFAATGGKNESMKNLPLP